MNKELFGTTCVGIARVSTYVQDTKAQSETLENKAKELGLTIERTFQTKESGFISLDKKDGFCMLQEYLKTSKCRIVIVTELSRLARRKIILEQIKQWFIDNKIQLYVINIGFTLFDDLGNATPTSDIVFSVFASIAESEMKEKRIRFIQVHKDLNQNGLSITGKVLFGYTRVNHSVKINGRWRSQMVVNEDAAKQVQQVYDWYLNGIDGDFTKCSISKIRDECIAQGFSPFLHSKRNVNKTLKCEFYTGEIVHTHYRRKNAAYWNYLEKDAPKYVDSEPGTVRYPQIITKEIFDSVQNKMNDANTKLLSDGKGGYADHSRSHFTLLAKLVKCNCGLSMTGDYRKGRGHSGNPIIVKTYRCTNHARHDTVTLPIRILDFAVWTICRQNSSKYLEFIQSFPFISTVEELRRKIGNLESERQILKNKQRVVSERYLKVLSYVSDESYNQEMDSLKKDLSRIDKLIFNEKRRLDELTNAKAEIVEYTDHLHLIESDKVNMRKYIQSMVEQIRPFFRDHYYTVTEIIMKDYSFAVKTSEPDAVAPDLPDKVYVIINTKTTAIPKISYISGPCLFDTQQKLFLLPNSDTATLAQVFEDEDEVYFHRMVFRPLDIDDTL